MLSVASQHTSVNILKLLAYGNGNWSLRKGIDRSRGSTKLVSAWVVYWHLTLGRSICQEIKMSFSPSRKWVLSIGCSSFGTELSWRVENPSLKTSRKQYHFRPNFLKITKKKLSTSTTIATDPRDRNSVSNNWQTRTIFSESGDLHIIWRLLLLVCGPQKMTSHTSVGATNHS